MAPLAPETRVFNKTDDMMIVKMVNEHGRVEDKKVIPAWGHEDFYYRKGIDRIGPPVTFTVEPDNRPGTPGSGILPYQMFEFANIEIVYRFGDDGSVSKQHRNGVSVHIIFKKGSTFGRIGLVRTFVGLCSSFVGKCCSAAAGTDQASGPIEAAPSAPFAVIVEASAPPAEAIAAGEAPLLQDPAPAHEIQPVIT